MRTQEPVSYGGVLVFIYVPTVVVLWHFRLHGTVFMACRWQKVTIFNAVRDIYEANPEKTPTVPGDTSAKINFQVLGNLSNFSKNEKTCIGTKRSAP